jgi:hypothetical protein
MPDWPADLAGGGVVPAVVAQAAFAVVVRFLVGFLVGFLIAG